MKTKLALAVAATAILCGCQTYQYRVVSPATSPAVVTNQPVVVKYDPLEYRLEREHGRLSINIANPTSTAVTMLENRSYVVDPHGVSHPLPGAVIGAHSFSWMLVPPEPYTYAVPYWGWNTWYWGPGWGPDGFYAPLYWGPPPVTYYEVRTPYDWDWKSGTARFRFTYDRQGTTFEHDLDIAREKAK